MEIYGYIYKIRNKINNKLYIGQTIYDFKHRYHNNLEHYTHNIHIKRAINKYGIENFEIDEKFDVAYSKDELDKLEDMYVKCYNTIDDKYGYNKRYGGGSKGKLTAETKQKLRDNHNTPSGKLHPMYGKGYKLKGSKNGRAKKVICLNTLEIFDTADEAAIKYNIGSGNKNGTQIIACCRKNRKLKTCGKLSNGEKIVWMYYSEYLNASNEEVQNIIAESRVSHKGENLKAMAKKVICISSGKIFDSADKAAEECNIKPGCIRNCCTGRNKSTVSPDGTRLSWRYAN